MIRFFKGMGAIFLLRRTKKPALEFSENSLHFGEIFLLCKRYETRKAHETMTELAQKGLSVAFSEASGKFYTVDWRKATQEAGSFFLNVLRQFQGEEA